MKRWLRIALTLALLTAIGAGIYAYQFYSMWTSPFGEVGNWCIEIPPDEDPVQFLKSNEPELAEIIEWRNWKTIPGRYCAIGIQPSHEVARRIATGNRAEISLTIPSKRDLSELAGAIAPKIWADSASLVSDLSKDSVLWRIIPNTYRVYWESTSEEIAQRLIDESNRWWNADRLKKAWALGLSQREVVILASIVQEETANLNEAPVVARLYLNRLKKNMLLQADPTLKFAIGDWEIRRLLDADKKIDSPYNTYRNPGLPPGPIRIPEPMYLEAVLNAPKHNYLYMCAKPDGSGTHAFASTYSEHLRNARAWQNMLNQQGVYR
ncbi:MAG: endolytic transglycosylase MltG [Bacteroidetes bacterium]|nr:endolytic transglycosylase MltG [Bacteroidota bacterium]MDA1335662.1 endolytic transglycosylase MltG [Bacteroidota bacterium]